MKITWFGQGCFQIITKEREHPQVSIITDPFDEDMDLKAPWKKADILLLSKKNKEEEVKKIAPQAFLIASPGEYEVKNVFIQGVKIKPKDEKTERTTVYTIKAEEFRICFLGAFSKGELSSEEVDNIGDVDILIVPIGGGKTIDSKQALKMISQIEPKTVVPMHYHIPGVRTKTEGLDNFLKAFGQESVQQDVSLTAKFKDIPKEDAETKVFVINPF